MTHTRPHRWAAVVLLVGVLGCRTGAAHEGPPPTETTSASQASADTTAPPTEVPPEPEPEALQASWPADIGIGGLSNAGSFWVSYVVEAPEVPLNETFELTLRIVDPQTRQTVIEGEELTVDARMPAHGHGMKQDPIVERNPDGSYRVRGMLLHMTGHWELYVDLRDGPLIERAQFDIDLE